VRCGNVQSYEAHQVGQKHKKKLARLEAAKSIGVPTVQALSGSQAEFCELCNVSCSGREVMLAHLCGTRHKKVGTVFSMVQ